MGFVVCALCKRNVFSVVLLQLFTREKTKIIGVPKRALIPSLKRIQMELFSRPQIQENLQMKGSCSIYGNDKGNIAITFVECVRFAHFKIHK